jgi:hypothetical protein
MKCDDATAAEAVISTLDGMELEGGLYTLNAVDPLA